MQRQALKGPFRGSGTERPDNLPLPPAPMPWLRAGRLLKRWRYVSIWSRELMICVGSVQVGPARQEFWAVWDRAERRLWERTRLRMSRVRLPPGRVLVDDGDVAIAIAIDENPGFEVVTPVGRAYTWTRKQIVQAHGSVQVSSSRLPVEAVALIDDNAGYHPRHTRWQWCGGAGTTVEGRSVAWSVIVGLNDSPEQSERTVWVDGVDREVGPVRFEPDLSCVYFAEGAEIRFTAEAVRERRDNLLLIRSRYRQPFGAFTGALPGGLVLREGYGVMEEHEAYW